MATQYGAVLRLVWADRDSHRSNHARTRDLDARRSHGPNDHWPRDVHPQRDHLPEWKVAAAGPRWPDAVQARAKEKKAMTDLYRVTSPDDPVLENGNKLCKGKPVAYLIVWKSEKVGNEADPRTLALFSGPKITAGSPDDCGRYTYDAGRP